MTDRVGDWLQTWTGRKFYVLDPRPEDFDIRDVAHSLSNQCRYAGHVDKFYSIAEHCVLLHDHVLSEDKALAYNLLMHDGAEAYYLDIPRPIKNNMPGIKEAMAIVDSMYSRVFSLRDDLHGVVNEYDKRIVIDEKQQLMNHHGNVEWHNYNNLDALGIEVKCWSPSDAKTEFLTRYWQHV